MKYLCLVYNDEQRLRAMTESEFDALAGGHLALDEELRKSGHHIASESLQPVRTAATVRVRHGRMSATEGPFAETEEQLGGFFLIEARDLNEAMRVTLAPRRATLCPRCHCCGAVSFASSIQRSSGSGSGERGRSWQR